MPHLIPILHPSAIVRGRWADEPAQITYMKNWVAIAKRDPSYAPVDIEKPPLETSFYPSAERIRLFHEELLTFKDPCLSIDTEEAGFYLICVGMTQLSLYSERIGRTMNVPIRLKGGRQAYPLDKLPSIIEALDDLFADERIAKLFHNGVGHDVPVLRDLGFKMEGDFYDTMILGHLAYPEMKKSLQFMATLYLQAPRWKSLIDEDDELEGK